MVKPCLKCKRNVVWVEEGKEERICVYCIVEEEESKGNDVRSLIERNKELRESLEKALKWWGRYIEIQGVTSGIEFEEYTGVSKNEKV